VACPAFCFAVLCFIPRQTSSAWPARGPTVARRNRRDAGKDRRKAKAKPEILKHGGNGGTPEETEAFKKGGVAEPTAFSLSPWKRPVIVTTPKDPPFPPCFRISGFAFSVHPASHPPSVHAPEHLRAESRLLQPIRLPGASNHTTTLVRIRTKPDALRASGAQSPECG